MDFEPQQTDTGFNPIGNRRKMGSSRRHKGRQQVKESATETYREHKEEVVEGTRGNDTLETTQMLLAIERTSQEELSQGSENAIIMPETHDSSLYSDIMSGYSSEVQNPTTTNYPEADLESWTPKSKNIQEEHDERETDFKVEVSDKSVGATLEGMDKSDTLQSQEVRGAHHSEDAVVKVHEEEVQQTQMQEIDYFSESVTHAATEDPEIISGNMDQAEVSDTYQSEMIVESTDDSATKQEDSNPGDKQDEHPTEENNFEALDNRHEDDHVYDTKKPQISDIERVDTALDQVSEIEGRVEDDMKPRAEQTFLKEKEGNFSEMDKCESSLQTLESEMPSSLDSQPQQIHTGFNTIGNRRKLGSSRRNKGRQHAKDSCDRYTEEVLGNTRDNEPLETTKMSFTVETAEQEKSMETTLEGIDTFDIHQTEEISAQVKENAHVGTLVGISELNCSTLHPILAVDQEMRDQSNFREMSEELPNVYSVPEKENKDRDKDIDLSRQNVNLQDNYLMSESHLKLVDIESSITKEISTEKNSPQERTEFEGSVEQAAFSSLQEESSANEEQKEHVNLSQVRGAWHSEDAVNEVHEEEVKLTITESESSLQTLQSEMNAPLDSQPLDNSQSIKQKTHTGFNPTGSRRKMGSSRRNKGREHVKDSFTETYHEPKEEFVENMRSDEALETAKMSLATETSRQEELKEQTALYLKPAERIRKIRSTVNDEENTEKVSNKDVNEEEKKLKKQPENLGQLPGDGTVKMDSVKLPEVSVLKDDSDTQNISYHDDNVNARPGQVQVSGQDEVGEEFEDPAKKDHEAQEKNVSHVITHAELCSAADNKTNTLAHVGLEENFKAKSAVDVPEESEISSPQGIQEKTHSDDGENLQGKSKQKRRKMGSTRRTPLSRKPEGGMDNKDDTKENDFNMEADMRNLDKMEVVEELPMIVTAEVSQNEDAKPSLSLVYKEQQETNETSPVHDKGQKLQSSTEEVVNPIKIVQVADIRDGERNVDVSLETLHLDDFTGTEMHITSVLAGRNSGSVNPLPSSNTEDASNTGITCETTQSTQNDEERLESVNVIQNQALKSAEGPVAAVADLEIVKSVVRGGGGGREEHKNAQAGIQEPNSMNEGAHDKNLEMKSASPNLNSTSRRRKMGSTRKNIGSRTKGEDLHQKQEVDNETAETITNVGNVKTESFSGIKEKELQLQDKDSDSEQRKEKVFETVEYSHTGESHFKPPAHETCEENPVPHGQQVETEHQLTPSYLPVIPSTSPKHDVMSESASGGRRRKMGSHRKSRGHQTNENQTARGDRITDTQNGGDDRSIPDESATKTTEESSLGLDKILEVSSKE